MKIAVADYAQALYELVSEKPDTAKATVGQFVTALRRDGKGKLLPSILAELDRIDASKSGRMEVTITVPTPIGEEQREQLATALKSIRKDVKTVTLHEIVDSTVLGGMKLQIGDTVIDHTVQTKLNTLAAKL